MPGPRRFRNVVSPDVIAERCAVTSGIPEMAPSFYPDPAQVTTEHVVYGRDADNIGVLVRPPGMKPLTDMTGYYDPAGRWRFFPEAIAPNEQPALRSYIAHEVAPAVRRTRHDASLLAGTTMADYFHPLTRQVRRAAYDHIREVDTADILLRPEGWARALSLGFFPETAAADAVVDDATLVYATLSPGGQLMADVEQVSETDHITHGYEARLRRAAWLTLMYAGVILPNPYRPGCTVRGMRQLLIGVKLEGADVWAPDLGVVSPTEWETLRPIVGIMEAADARYPDFSPMLCTIARNAPDAF